MATITLNCSKAMIQKMEKFYQQQLTPPPAYAKFAAKTSTAHITAYNSGKVVFQGKDPLSEASRWQEIKEDKGVQLPADFSQWNVMGSDETGNGSYFGPVTVCATYVTRDTAPQLIQLGVRDSKALTDQKMRQIAPQIKALIPYQLLVVTPEKYNQVQPKYNAVKMKSVLHNRALALLEQKIAPQKAEGILIDQFTSPEHYRKDIQNESPKPLTKLYFATKGENKHLAVAAASIIARVAFLDELKREGELVNLPSLPSGAGHNVDQVAAALIKRYGEPILSQVAKLHFANTKKAIQLAKK